MRIVRYLVVIVILGVAVVGGYLWWQETQRKAIDPPPISFAPLLDENLKDPDFPNRPIRMDFVEVEKKFPLSQADRMAITPDSLKALSQEQIDQIYGRISAGPIPDGVYYGDLFFPTGVDGQARLRQIFGGLSGRIAETKVHILEDFSKALWKGKFFDKDARILRNFIEDLSLLKPLLGGDDEGIETITIERVGWFDKLFKSDEVWLLFPAKLYCGQSLLDGRRESVIIDYAYNDELPGYRAQPDALAGRNGLAVRDEIRMIRPGFYLGRAYVNRLFLLNFTLYNAAIAEQQSDWRLESIEEECWNSKQLQVARQQ